VSNLNPHLSPKDLRQFRNISVSNQFVSTATGSDDEALNAHNLDARYGRPSALKWRIGLKKIMVFSTSSGPHNRMRRKRAKRSKRCNTIRPTVSITINHHLPKVFEDNAGNRKRKLSRKPIFDNINISTSAIAPFFDVRSLPPSAVFAKHSNRNDPNASPCEAESDGKRPHLTHAHTHRTSDSRS
jgi:hypothetical protein